MTMELNLIELDHVAQQRVFAQPAAQERNGFTERHAVIQLGEADHIAAAPAAIAIEQTLARVHQETGFAVGVERANSHQPPASNASGGLPILAEQIIQQRNPLLE